MIRREGGGRGVETVVAAAVASRTQTEYIIAPSPPYIPQHCRGRFSWQS